MMPLSLRSADLKSRLNGKLPGRTITSAAGEGRWPGAMFSTMGIPKAAVLPFRSGQADHILPLRASGMARFWISEGSVKPMLLTA